MSQLCDFLGLKCLETVVLYFPFSLFYIEFYHRFQDFLSTLAPHTTPWKMNGWTKKKRFFFSTHDFPFLGPWVIFS